MSTKQRLERLRARMVEKGLDGLLISQPESRRYVSGFTGSAGNLFISKSVAVLVTDFRYTEQATKQSPDFEVFQAQGPMKDWLPDLLKRLNAPKVGFEAEHMTVATHKRFQDLLQGAGAGMPELVSTEGLVSPLREIKDAEELEAIKKAIRASDYAIETVVPAMKPGMTEKAVAWEIFKAMKEAGAEGESFPAIVASGPNGAMAHHRPSDDPIQAGVPIVLDIGAIVDGYCSDLTRTICIGKPDAQFIKVYDTVLTAQLAAINAVTAGMTAGEADNLARSVIEKAGYGETFGHALGHGVGLAVHEEPRLAKGVEDKLVDGMVFTIEPGIYISGWGGVRIEDIVVLEGGKARLLSHAPKRELQGVKK